MLAIPALLLRALVPSALQTEAAAGPGPEPASRNSYRPGQILKKIQSARLKHIAESIRNLHKTDGPIIQKVGTKKSPVFHITGPGQIALSGKPALKL